MPDFRIPSVERTPTVHAGISFVNANAILEKALQSIQAEDRGKVILRCDDLPFFPGLASDLESIFRCLLQTILAKKEEVARLFLHISCAGEEGRETTPALAYYSILFHSNILLTADWKQAHQALIDEASQLLQKYNGGLVLNQTTNSGCIFSVSLPGKFL